MGTNSAFVCCTEIRDDRRHKPAHYETNILERGPNWCYDEYIQIAFSQKFDH